jgi:alpha-tubulin suppressor-like RCC1 family protein
MEGQLGDGTTTERHAPVAVIGLGGRGLAITAGSYHTCAIVAGPDIPVPAGRVRCWGQNDFGQLGNATTRNRSTPVDVADLSGGAVSVNAGGFVTCALSQGSAGPAEVKCWGRNDYGQLGDGTATQRWLPTPVYDLGIRANVISVNQWHTCATLTLADTGSAGPIRCWGGNFAGGLGDGATAHRLSPVSVIGWHWTWAFAPLVPQAPPAR